ncbi:MAG: hypothetical protein ACOX6I_00680 [Syntrophomonadaceae bacterium]|jgi:hypothetical protein
MQQTVLSIYKDIMEQVLIRENYKRDISRKILMLKKSSRRLILIYSFLGFDLDKHRLLEYAAIIALNNGNTVILPQLKRFYIHTEEGDILDQIRKEILLVSKYMEILNKGIRRPENCSFIERRMVQEISKYVLALAKAYNQPPLPE